MTLTTSSSELPHISIITAHAGPATKDDLLFCTVASVADQEGIKSEHILQHASGVTGLWGKLSRDVGLSKRTSNYLLRVLEEKNADSYQALHLGLNRATAPLIGFLQPGEQYLPGALAAIVAEFESNPDLDFLITGSLTLDEADSVSFSTPGILPSQEYLWTVQPALLSGALFCRTSLFRDGFTFDSRFGQQTITEGVLRLLQAGKKGGSLITTTTLLSVPKSTSSEKEASFPTAPTLTSLLRPWWKSRHESKVRQHQKKHPTPETIARYSKDNLKERSA